MVDGWRPDVISAADTPTLDRLWPDSAYSLAARVEDTTISGSGQSTFVTGVHRDKHGVHDNSFSSPNYGEYPYWFRLLDEAAPHLITGAYHTWWPMYEHALGGEDGADFAYFWDYGDEEGDARTTAQLQIDLLTEDLDVVVWMISDLDTTGHGYGFSPSVPEYVDAMSLIDSQMGDVLDAIASRATIDDEDWMVIISTDHAGSGTGHGYNIPEHRLVPLFVHGGGAVPGPIWPAPNAVSIVPTALAHLGVAIDEAWGLDGPPVGLEATAPPTPVLEENVIINGGAEMERGFGDFLPDAALPGWVDHGWGTAIRYGSDGFPSIVGPGPEHPGENFLCGGHGGSNSVIYQDVDLSSLAGDIDGGGIGYRFQGWLGGYSDQNDRAEVILELFDAAGAPMMTSTLDAVSASERDDVTGLKLRSRFGMVPPFARSARITIHFIRDAGGNDGYVDNLSLILTAG
jgi:hypothetical protein